MCDCTIERTSNKLDELMLHTVLIVR